MSSPESDYSMQRQALVEKNFAMMIYVERKIWNHVSDDKVLSEKAQQERLREGIRITGSMYPSLQNPM